MKDYRIL